MRKCIRCQTPMVENLDIKVDMKGYGIKITQEGIFGDPVQKPKVAICPACGEISLYIERTDKLNQLKKHTEI